MTGYPYVGMGSHWGSRATRWGPRVGLERVHVAVEYRLKKHAKIMTWDMGIS